MEKMEGDSGMGEFYHYRGKEPKHKGHEVHKGKKVSWACGVSFVAFVDFVFKEINSAFSVRFAIRIL
jgi:hypothetical protein